MTDNWEMISTTGTYKKWEDVGDTVEGVIISFTVDGGSDFNGDPCPEMTVRTDNGETVIVSAGQANLRRAFTVGAGKLRPGHKVRVTFEDTYQTDKGSVGKSFNVAVSPEPVLEDLAATNADEEPF